MASSSKSTIGVSDYEEPRFEDDLQFQAAIRNSLQEPNFDDREPSFDERLRAAIHNSLQKEPTFDDTFQAGLHTATRDSLQELSFDDALKAAIRNSLLER